MNTFESLHSLEEVDNFINEHEFAFLYVTMPNCSVCQGLLPQIEDMISNFPNITARKVDAFEVEAIAGRFEIFTAPVLLLFINGKEYIREARFVQTAKLDDKIYQLYHQYYN